MYKKEYKLSELQISGKLIFNKEQMAKIEKVTERDVSTMRYSSLNAETSTHPL